MNTIKSPETKARWRTLWRRLDSVRFDPLPTEAELAQALAGLPVRQADEPLADWLNRAKTAAESSASPVRRGAVVPFPKARLRPLAEIRLKAAADEKYPLPQRPVETPDRQFRLTITQVKEGLKVFVEALGLAMDRYAGQYIGIAASEDLGSLVAVLFLNEDGEAAVVVDDDEQSRRVLCVKPVVCLIEPNHA